MLKGSKDKKEKGELAIRYDAHDTPINTTTQEDINNLLASGYEVNDDRIPDPKIKNSPTGDTDQ